MIENRRSVSFVILKKILQEFRDFLFTMASGAGRTRKYFKIISLSLILGFVSFNAASNFVSEYQMNRQSSKVSSNFFQIKSNRTLLRSIQ